MPYACDDAVQTPHHHPLAILVPNTPTPSSTTPDSKLQREDRPTGNKQVLYIAGISPQKTTGAWSDSDTSKLDFGRFGSK
jgi:hypothetical protein